MWWFCFVSVVCVVVFGVVLFCFLFVCVVVFVVGGGGGGLVSNSLLNCYHGRRSPTLAVLSSLCQLGCWSTSLFKLKSYL